MDTRDTHSLLARLESVADDVSRADSGLRNIIYSIEKGGGPHTLIGRLAPHLERLCDRRTMGPDCPAKDEEDIYAILDVYREWRASRD